MLGKAPSFTLTKENFRVEQGNIEEKLLQMGIEHMDGGHALQHVVGRYMLPSF